MWKRTGKRREIDRVPYDPLLAADIGRAVAHGPLDDQPLPSLPQPVRVPQEEWRDGDAVEWRDA